MTQDEMRKIIDQYFIDGDDSYECRVRTNDLYMGDEKELLCSISSYVVSIEPGHNFTSDSVGLVFYVHPKECLNKCPPISREAIDLTGEFSMTLELNDIVDERLVYERAKEKVDAWLTGTWSYGIDKDDDDGKHMKPSEKTLNFLYALVAYYYGVMKKKAEKEKK